MTGSGMSPCAACKLLRRRCTRDCVFAPYFPPDEPQKFANVHKVFGAANVNKMLQELPVQARGDAVSSMVYEADARVRDPVYGCVGAISSLQQQVAHLQTQLAVANAEIVCMQINNDSNSDCSHGYNQSDAPGPSSHHHGGYSQHHYGNHLSPPMQPQSPEVHSNPYRASHHYSHNSESFGEHMMWT